MNEKQCEELKEKYKLLKKVDEYAKSLGLTLYFIETGININGEECYLSDSTLNPHPKQYSLSQERQDEYKALKQMFYDNYTKELEKHNFKITNRYPSFEIVEELN